VARVARIVKRDMRRDDRATGERPAEYNLAAPIGQTGVVRPDEGAVYGPSAYRTSR